MRLEYLKLGNSVKCGQHEKTFFEDKDFEMTVTRDIIVKIVCRRSKKRVYTSLMNAISWDSLEESASEAPINIAKLPQKAPAKKEILL